VLGEVEVLDAEHAGVPDVFEPANDRGEVDDAGRVVDVDLRVAPAALTQLDVA
jgi:hypothetical protein